MPINEELTIRMDNLPGSLGKVCHALADRGVNILAFQSIPGEKTILVCMVVDTPAAAAAILDKEGISYTEGEIVQPTFPAGPVSWHGQPPSWATPISTSITHTAVSSQR
jgi:hypothetical protein